MVPYQRGLPEPLGLKQMLNPLSGTWHPVVSSWTPLIGLILGVTVIAWIAWRMPAWAIDSPDRVRNLVPGCRTGETSDKGMINRLRQLKPYAATAGYPKSTM
jgi:hypothetical protein